MEWFRLYHRILYSSKHQSLPGNRFKSWLNLMCLASMQTPRWRLPPMDEIGRHLGIKPSKANDIVRKFVRDNFIDFREGHYWMHDVDDWQSEADNSTQRTRQWRERQRTQRLRGGDRLSKKTKDLAKKGTSPKRHRDVTRDAASDHFCEEFKKQRGIPYDPTKPDFVVLARLRRRLGTPAKECPEGWEIAVGNYLASDLSQYDIKGLASGRYDVFLRSPVDRFGHPTKQGGLFNEGESRQDGASDYGRRTKRGDPGYRPKQ